MTKVHINGGLHQVEVEHDSNDLSYVIEKAQKLWEETKPDIKVTGPTMGYTTSIRLDGRP